MPPRIHSTCTLPGCANPHYATGLCRGHYVARRSAAVRAASRPISGGTQAAIIRAHMRQAAAANKAAQAVPAAPSLPAVPAAPPQRAVDLPPVFNDKGQPGFPVRDSSRPPGWKQAQAVPAAPSIPVAAPCVPPAPVLPGSRPVPDVPAPPPVLPHAPNVPAAPMLPIIPAPPVIRTVTAADAAAMRRDYGASVPVGSKVYTLDQSKGDAGLFAQVEAILSQSKPQSK